MERDEFASKLLRAAREHDSREQTPRDLYNDYELNTIANSVAVRHSLLAEGGEKSNPVTVAIRMFSVLGKSGSLDFLGQMELYEAAWKYHERQKQPK